MLKWLTRKNLISRCSPKIKGQFSAEPFHYILGGNMATIQTSEPKRVRFKRWLLCHVLGWHNNKYPDQPPPYFDGISWYGRCSRCGKSVMLDSHGRKYNHPVDL